jgi:hypothetical protein
MATLAEQLASVQAAIAEIEGGAQSTSSRDGRRRDRADLATLYAREKDLMRRIGRQGGGGVFVGDLG